MAKIYVASSLENAVNVINIYDYLICNDHIITYNWTKHGRITKVEDLREVGRNEFDGVVDCDLLIMLMPARLGSHVELGIALALGKPVIIITADLEYEDKSFYHLDNVHITNDVLGLNTMIHKLLEG
jgi:nucleoside 2-deoxyribosyltransferase